MNARGRLTSAVSQIREAFFLRSYRIAGPKSGCFVGSLKSLSDSSVAVSERSQWVRHGRLLMALHRTFRTLTSPQMRLTYAKAAKRFSLSETRACDCSRGQQEILNGPSQSHMFGMRSGAGRRVTSARCLPWTILLSVQRSKSAQIVAGENYGTYCISAHTIAAVFTTSRAVMIIIIMRCRYFAFIRTKDSRARWVAKTGYSSPHHVELMSYGI